jgi:hypothetical protein
MRNPLVSYSALAFGGRPVLTRPERLMDGPPCDQSEDVVNYCFPKDWPADRERRLHHRRVAANRSAFVNLMTEFGGLVGGADVMSALVPGVKNTSWRIDHLIGASEV